MSQVKFTVGDVEIMAGWDSPCSEFYLTVFSNTEEDEVVWSSIDDWSRDDHKGVIRLRAKLVELAIDPPSDFWDIVLRRGGNVTYTHSLDGWVCQFPSPSSI